MESTSLEVKIRKECFRTNYATSNQSLSTNRFITVNLPKSKPKVNRPSLDSVIPCVICPATAHSSLQVDEMTNSAPLTRHPSSTTWSFSYLTKKFGSELNTLSPARRWITLVITVSVLSATTSSTRRFCSLEESKTKLMRRLNRLNLTWAIVPKS